MSYFWMEYSYNLGNDTRQGSMGLPSKTLAEATKRITKEITDKHSDATDIAIWERPKNEGKPHLIDELVKRVREERPDLSAEHVKDCEFHLLTNPGREDYKAGGFWKPIGPEAKEVISLGDYADFVYIRRWGIILFNVSCHTSHEIFMSEWNWILSHMLDSDKLTFDNMPHLGGGDDAEDFLHNCHGVFISRVGSSVVKSTNMKFTAAERIMFDGMRIREIDPEE